MPGMYVYRASRIEALAEQLAQQLAAQPPAAVLAPRTVVVAHLGMKRWLLGALARRRASDGSPGIAANLRLLLPGEWWLRLGDALLGSDADPAWQREVLRWRILDRLDARDVAGALRRFLDAAPPRRRWQLAEHLARLYGEYQMYRPDWLLAWAAGDDTPRDADWQAALWRRLLAGSAAQPRVQRSQRVLEMLAAARAGHAEPVHVFGVSHLPPVLLQALQLAARTRAVHVYFPDPCRELWDDLRSRRALLRAGDEAAAQHYETGHPLLASLGRIGQDFALALNADVSAQDWRDPLDERDAHTAAAPLLQRVQDSLRRLAPQLAGAPLDAQSCADSSLRVHACHGRLRELEVLRDALLALRVQHDDLEPRQIVVMAPDIQAYAPLLPAVFGTPGQWHDAALPYHIADVPLAATHTLYAAWRQLLHLAQARCTLAEVLDLLDVPALARRFGLDGAARTRMAHWLHEAHVAWALDAAMKPAFGAPAEDLHTFAFGLDRLIAGWLLGDDAPGRMLPAAHARGQAIVPLLAAAGSELPLLAGLARLLDELAHWRAAGSMQHDGAGWSAWLAQRIAACFESAGEDAAEQTALEQLRRLAAQPGAELAAAGVERAFAWEVISAQQCAALDEIPARQPFVANGIAFCGMVPQRTIPYRVVALLGLNEGAYPRNSPRSSLDLILRHPRAGDRSALQEDRYLFLEALMAARTALHLSYVAEDPAQGSLRNPAAPLAELLAFLDDAHGLAGGDAARPWCVRHALQPFAAVYFEQADATWRPHPALRSFAVAYAGVNGAGHAPPGAAPLLPHAGLSAPALDADAASLAQLRAFLRKPAQATARQMLGIVLPDGDADAGADEPLTPRTEPRQRVPARLLEHALAQGQATLPAHAPDWLARSGLLPAGAIGALAWRDLRAPVAAALDLLHGHPCAQAPLVEVDCRVRLDDGNVLGGSVAARRDAAGRYWLLRVETRKTLDFSVRLPLWLDWAALALSVPAAQLGGCVLLQVHGASAEIDTLAANASSDATLLRAGIARLCALRDDVLHARRWYFPATAWAVAESAPESRSARARSAWEGNQQSTGERDYAPAYAALLARGRDWIAEPQTWRDFVAQACALAALVGLQAQEPAGA